MDGRATRATDGAGMGSIEGLKPIRQAGVLPLRRTPRGYEVLLITNRSGRWIVPKGMIDEGQTARQAAAVEAREEAGVRGLIGRRLGRYDYVKSARLHRVELFAMRVRQELQEWDEQHKRRRRWVTLSVAVQLVAHQRGLVQVLSGVERRATRARTKAA